MVFKESGWYSVIWVPEVGVMNSALAVVNTV